MFSFTGSPGSIFFLMPSRPADTIAENARYGLAEGSGARNSTRFERELPLSFTGTRMTADLFPRDQAAYTGASKPGTILRYEFTVGATSAAREAEWSNSPPIKYLPAWL